MTTAEEVLAAADFAGQETPSSTAVNDEFPYRAIKERERLPVQSSNGDQKKFDIFCIQQKAQTLTSAAFCSWSTALSVSPSPRLHRRQSLEQLQIRGGLHRAGTLPGLAGPVLGVVGTASAKEQTDVLTSALWTSCTGMGLRSATNAGPCFPILSTALPTFLPLEICVNIL